MSEVRESLGFCQVVECEIKYLYPPSSFTPSLETHTSLPQAVHLKVWTLLKKALFWFTSGASFPVTALLFLSFSISSKNPSDASSCWGQFVHMKEDSLPTQLMQAASFSFNLISFKILQRNILSNTRPTYKFHYKQYDKCVSKNISFSFSHPSSWVPTCHQLRRIRISKQLET